MKYNCKKVQKKNIFELIYNLEFVILFSMKGAIEFLCKIFKYIKNFDKIKKLNLNKFANDVKIDQSIKILFEES